MRPADLPHAKALLVDLGFTPGFMVEGLPPLFSAWGTLSSCTLPRARHQALLWIWKSPGLAPGRWSSAARRPVLCTPGFVTVSGHSWGEGMNLRGCYGCSTAAWPLQHCGRRSEGSCCHGEGHGHRGRVAHDLRAGATYISGRAAADIADAIARTAGDPWASGGDPGEDGSGPGKYDDIPTTAPGFFFSLNPALAAAGFNDCDSSSLATDYAWAERHNINTRWLVLVRPLRLLMKHGQARLARASFPLRNDGTVRLKYAPATPLFLSVEQVPGQNKTCVTVNAAFAADSRERRGKGNATWGHTEYTKEGVRGLITLVLSCPESDTDNGGPFH